jgi:hypothetical protein
MSQASPPEGGGSPVPDEEAARLRRENPGWLVIWLDRTQQYRAYRLSQRRRAGALTAATPDEMAAQISQAEQAAVGEVAAAHVTGMVVPPATGPGGAAT